MDLSVDAFRRAVDTVLGGDPWTYGPLDPDARTVDCSAFVALVLREIYEDRFDRDLWRAVNVWDPADPFSGPRAMEAAGLGDANAGGHVLYVQGWSRLPTDDDPGKGHAFFLVYPPGSSSGEIVESSPGVGPRTRPRPAVSLAGAHPAGYEIVSLFAPNPPHPGGPVSTAFRPPAIPPEVRDEAEEALETASGVAISAVVDALADGKIEPDEAKAQIARVLASVVDGLGDVLDALLVLPEPLESLSDAAIAAGVSEARKAIVPALGEIGDALRDVLHRDADELEARAKKIEARNPKKAARLREKAAARR